MLLSGGQLVLSDTTPSVARSTFLNRSGIDLSRLFSTYAALYRTNFIVQTVVGKLARSTARLPLKVYERTADGRAEARTSPFSERLRRPNPQPAPRLMWLWPAL